MGRACANGLPAILERLIWPRPCTWQQELPFQGPCGVASTGAGACSEASRRHALGSKPQVGRGFAMGPCGHSPPSVS